MVGGYKKFKPHRGLSMGTVITCLYKMIISSWYLNMFQTRLPYQWQTGSIFHPPDAAGTSFSGWGNSGFGTLVYAIDPANLMNNSSVIKSENGKYTNL